MLGMRYLPPDVFGRTSHEATQTSPYRREAMEVQVLRQVLSSAKCMQYVNFFPLLKKMLISSSNPRTHPYQRQATRVRDLR